MRHDEPGRVHPVDERQRVELVLGHDRGHPPLDRLARGEVAGPEHRLALIPEQDRLRPVGAGGIPERERPIVVRRAPDRLDPHVGRDVDGARLRGARSRARPPLCPRDHLVLHVLQPDRLATAAQGREVAAPAARSPAEDEGDAGTRVPGSPDLLDPRGADAEVPRDRAGRARRDRRQREERRAEGRDEPAAVSLVDGHRERRSRAELARPDAQDAARRAVDAQRRGVRQAGPDARLPRLDDGRGECVAGSQLHRAAHERARDGDGHNPSQDLPGPQPARQEPTAHGSDPSQGRVARVGLATGSARLGRPERGPRIIASRCGQRSRPPAERARAERHDPFAGASAACDAHLM